MSEPKKRGRQLDASSKSGQIRTLLGSGMSASDIVKKLGCTPALVYNVKARMAGGTKKRGPGRHAIDVRSEDCIGPLESTRFTTGPLVHVPGLSAWTSKLDSPSSPFPEAHPRHNLLHRAKDLAMAANLDLIFSSYVEHVVSEPGACAAWKTNEDWTPIATGALANVARACFPEVADIQIAHKGHPDRDGQSEHLGLDLVCWSLEHCWNPPLFIAEVEGKPTKDAVPASAWKLLVVDASVRVMATFFGPGTRYSSYSELLSALQVVCNANPARELILLAAEAIDAPTPADIMRVHRRPVHLIG